MDSLDTGHEKPLHRAITNLLATEVVESTLAQILDGLPTQKSVSDGFTYMHDHPVFELRHYDICEGFLEKAREHIAKFNISEVSFPPLMLQAFQDEIPGSKGFHLRLVELVVSAFHQIAIHLYELDDGFHKHQLHHDWLEELSDEHEEISLCRHYSPPPVAFFHKDYRWPELYSGGVADVVGYWAEGKIFGGVIWFDRGESEQECNDMWIHGDLVKGPRTLYPPTQQQFHSLITFLLADPDDKAKCPLPIHGTPENRPRWDPYDALSMFHIFREKSILKVPSSHPERQIYKNVKPMDWPELGDEMVLEQQNQCKQFGESYDEAVIAAAEANLTLITPSSPCWRPRPEWRQR